MNDRSAQRLFSLDVFRGITVAAMLLVNNPGSWSAIYPPLEHAEWHGWTPTDLIFPFFLFIVGVTTELALRRRRENDTPSRDVVLHAIRRGSGIVLLGLALNAFPFYTWGTVEGIAQPTFLQRVVDRFQHLRYAGVLQRIGIVYLFTVALTIRSSLRARCAMIVGILVGYWLLLTVVRVPDSGLRGAEVLDLPDKTIAASVDRAVLGTKHIWKQSGTWDPEGPVSTIPAIATALFGTLAGSMLAMRQKDAMRMLVVSGAIATVIGLLWGQVFPINKNLWTSSYVVFTAGAASLLLGAIIWIVDVRGVRRWSEPFVAFGINPLVAFVGSGIMARLTDSLLRWYKPDGKRTTLHLWLYDHLLAGWLPPRVASLVYALAFVTLWYFILAQLRRRNIVVKL